MLFENRQPCRQILVGNVQRGQQTHLFVRLHLADRTTITTLFRLKNMEAALPAASFMRVHRSYIVNLQRIKGFVKGRIFLSDDEYVPIGENYRDAFQEYIDTHYRNL